ncbi:MAG TPA: hypothetical protein VF083_02495 [Acidimicrobiia bacterium]
MRVLTHVLRRTVVTAILVALLVGLAALAAGAAGSDLACNRCDEPEVTLQFVKSWVGDDPGQVEVVFFIDGHGPIAAGEVIEVTELQGKNVSLEERVTGLPAACTYESDLPATLAIPKVDDDTLITVNATNAVTCVSDEVVTTTSTTSTTVPDQVLPIVVTTTTRATTTTVFSEVLPTEVTTSAGPAVVAETLPFTGSTDLGWLLLGGEILVLGSVLVIASRSKEAEF